MTLHEKQNVRGPIADAMVIAGTGLVSYGAWLIFPPLGFIVPGTLLLLIGGIATVRR